MLEYICFHGNDNGEACLLCHKEEITELQRNLGMEKNEVYNLRRVLSRVLRTVRKDVFQLEHWPQFEGDFIDGVCDLLKELGKEE